MCIYLTALLASKVLVFGLGHGKHFAELMRDSLGLLKLFSILFQLIRLGFKFSVLALLFQAYLNLFLKALASVNRKQENQYKSIKKFSN
jgi:hypothetical protein